MRSSGPSPGRPGPLQEVDNNAPHKYLCNKRLRTAKNIQPCNGRKKTEPRWAGRGAGEGKEVETRVLNRNNFIAIDN